MPAANLILLWLGLICFLVGIINPQPPGVRNINWVALGLGLITLAYLIRGT